VTTAATDLLNEASNFLSSRTKRMQPGESSMQAPTITISRRIFHIRTCIITTVYPLCLAAFRLTAEAAESKPVDVPFHKKNSH